jgi:hypothetical protein
MNPQKEMRWLIRIYNSIAVYDLKKLRLKNNAVPLKKTDFERVVKAPIRHMEFSEWFDMLVKEGVLSFVGKIKINNSSSLANGYIADASEIVRYIKNNKELNEIYEDDKKFYSREAIL